MSVVTLPTQKRWVVAQQLHEGIAAGFQRHKINRILAQVLYNRGLEDPEDASRFLYTRDLSNNPFGLKDIDKAVGRIRTAIARKEPIIVYGDFDADGVTSTTLLVQALRALGGNAHPYIPHRIEEGYGLNIPALQEIASKGGRLVITVDCGIRSVEEVEAGKAAGLDIIVTDHHSLGPELPNAYAVVNPKQGQYPEQMLAGVGVAYKLAEALFEAQRKNGRKGQQNALNLETLLDLVAIGTVADLMPLNRLENRSLVRRGLEVLNKAERPGVRALLEVAGAQPGNLNAMSIGFTIGPRINAAGRLDSAMIAYHLLAARTMEEAMPLAERLQKLNVERQDLTRSAQEVIRHKIGTPEHLIFAGDSSFIPGIVGLVAGKLVEEYYLPTVIMEETEGEEEWRASCRSIPEFDITAALDECADLLVRHGGHTLAAGFTVHRDNVGKLRERLTEIAAHHLQGKELIPKIDIDAELSVDTLSEQLVKDLEMLEPTGHGNNRPVFMCSRVRVVECRTVGRDERHLKLKIGRDGQPPLDAIGFGLGGWAYEINERIDVAFELEMNEWNGRQNLQMRLQDVRHPQG